MMGKNINIIIRVDKSERKGRRMRDMKCFFLFLSYRRKICKLFHHETTCACVTREKSLLDELLCLEESSKVQHLPCSETEQTAHTENTEKQHSIVGRFWKELREINQCIKSINYLPFVSLISSSRFLINEKSCTMASDKSSSFFSSNSSGFNLAASAIYKKLSINSKSIKG